jgi:hypothetical protein
MKHTEFDDLAVSALRDDGSPNDRVWAAVRPKPKASWLPTWPEIGIATAAGAFSLCVLASVAPSVPQPPQQIVASETKPKKPFDDSLVAVNRLAGVNPAMLNQLSAEPK